MTLPPTQNQYPGWEPPKQDEPQQNINDFGAGAPASSNANNTNIPPIQNTQPSQTQAQTPQSATNDSNNSFEFQPQPVQPGQPAQPQTFGNGQADNLNQPANQPNAGGPKSKKPFKGPLLLLAGVIIIFGAITGLVLLTSKKQTSNNNATSDKQVTKADSKKTDNSTKSDASKTAPANDKDTKANTASTDTTDQADGSNQPYEFIDNQQMSNLKNLQTSLTTYQSQNAKKQLPPATPQGWALLKANNVVDPVTDQPYAFAASNNPNVGEVQYAAKSVCASDNTVIASTDLGSFALRTRLYNGTYYCVDSSNA